MRIAWASGPPSGAEAVTLFNSIQLPQRRSEFVAGQAWPSLEISPPRVSPSGLGLSDQPSAPRISSLDENEKRVRARVRLSERDVDCLQVDCVTAEVMAFDWFD